jgi:HPt (histidine-containing phosphotransfer) domain-containing protein
MEGKMENNNGKHTDLTYLRGLAKGSNAFIIQMLNIYITQVPGVIERIEKALEKKDWKSLRFAVHKLKPSAMFVGLNEIKNDIPLLEDYSAEEIHLDKIPALVDKIKQVCMEAVPELHEELQKLK